MQVMLSVRAVIKGSDGKILFVQRNLSTHNNPGLWEVPGGKVDRNELPEVAILREAKEEVGLNIQAISPLVAGVQRYVADSSQYHDWLVLPLLQVFTAEGNVLLSHEHISYRWQSLPEIVSAKDLIPGLVSSITELKPWL